MNRFLWPLIGFIVLVVLLAVGLNLNPRDVPSPLVGKPAPSFTLTTLDTPEQHFSPKDMLGKVWLLNVWATWCVSCRQEHFSLHAGQEPLLSYFTSPVCFPVFPRDPVRQWQG